MKAADQVHATYLAYLTAKGLHTRLLWLERALSDPKGRASAQEPSR